MVACVGGVPFVGGIEGVVASHLGTELQDDRNIDQVEEEVS